MRNTVPVPVSFLCVVCVVLVCARGGGSIVGGGGGGGGEGIIARCTCKIFICGRTIYSVLPDRRVGTAVSCGTAYAY